MGTQNEGRQENTFQLLSLSSNPNNLSCSSHEEATLINKKRRVSLESALRLRLGVLVVSWISVVLLFVMGVFTLDVAIEENSSASFAFALDAILDSMSSAVVIWRYSGNGSNLYNQHRECVACLVLSVFFIISAIAIAVRSGMSLVTKAPPDQSATLWWLSMINGTSCFILVTAKLFLSYKLESKALMTDAFNTAVGVLIAFATVAGFAIYDIDNSIWMIDPVAGAIGSLLLFGYGIWIMVHSLRVLGVCKFRNKPEDVK